MKHTRTILLLLGLGMFALYVTAFYAARMPTLEDQLRRAAPQAGAEEGPGEIPGPVWRRAYVFQFLLFPEHLLKRWLGEPMEVGVQDRLPVLLIAGVILAYAWSLGWLLMALCRSDRGLARLEIYVFSTAVGLLGWLRNPLVFAIPAALTLAAAGRLRWRRVMAGLEGDRQSKPVKRKKANPAAAEQNDPWLSPRWLWLAVPFVLMILLGGMLPPVDFDVREYHLQVPKEFFQQGHIAFLPHNVYGNMAMGTQMHSLLAMVIAEAVGGDWWLGGLAGKTVIAAMAPLTALALFAAGRRFFSTAAGVVAAVIYLSIPWIVQVSTAGLVEGGSAYYLLLSVYAVLLCGRGHEEACVGNRPARKGRGKASSGNCPARKGREKASSGDSPARKGGVAPRDDSPAKPRPPGWGYSYLLLAGYLAGGAVACKYPAVLFVVLPLAVWLLLLRVNDGLRAGLGVWRPVGIFLLAAFVGCGLWFGKNWVLTGNPTYPLLYEVFGGETRTPEKNRQWNNAHRPKDFSPATLGKDVARVGLRSEWLSPLLVPLAVLAFLDQKRRRLVIALLAYFGYVIAAWWLLTHRIDRFWVPALPLLALLGGAGACWSRRPGWRWLLIAVLVVGLVANFLVADLAVGYGHYFVSLDRLRHDVEQVDRPGRVDPWHHYLNTHVGRGRVLMVGEAEVFDLEVQVLYNTCFDDCLFEQLVRGRSAGEVRAALAKHKISHVYVDWGEIGRYRSPGNYGFTDFVRPPVFEELVGQGILQPLPEIEGHPGRGYRVLRSGR